MFYVFIVKCLEGLFSLRYPLYFNSRIKALYGIVKTMSFEKIQFIALTALTGFAIGFLATFLGVKISKFLIMVGLILLIVFYLFVNGSFEIDWLNIKTVFEAKVDSLGNDINSVKRLLLRNIPLTIGVIIGAFYGLKKA